MERAIMLSICMLLLFGCAQMAAPPSAMPHQNSTSPQHAPPGNSGGQPQPGNATPQQPAGQFLPNASENQTANSPSQMPAPNQTNASASSLPPMEQWALEDGTRVPEGVSPSPILLGNTTVLYYTGIGGIFRASSSDGVDFGASTEVLTQASNSAIFPLKDGGYRMICNDMSAPVQPGQRHPSSQYFLSAYSANGLDWEKEAGVRFRSPGAPDYDTVSVPCVVDLGNGTLRMYFVGDMYARDYGRQGNSIRSAISNDEGLTWAHEPGERISGDSMDPAVRKIGNYYRLYYTVTDFELDEQKVHSALSPDGLNFTKEGVVLETGVPGERLMDPDFLEANGTLRMYISLATGSGQSEQTRLVSAVLENQPASQNAALPGAQPDAASAEPARLEIKVPASDPFKDPNGPYYHKVYSATSRDGLDWQTDGTVVFDYASVPGAVLRKDGTLLVYYVDGTMSSASGLIAAKSGDLGKSWVKYGVVLSNLPQGEACGADPEPEELGNGTMRLYLICFLPGDGGPSGTETVSALSENGIVFGVENGVRAESQQGETLTDPDVLKMGGAWRMYISQGMGVVSLASSDGLVFARDPGYRNTIGAVTNSLVFPDGKARHYFCGIDGIKSARSEGGDWSVEAGIRIPKGSAKQVCDPNVVELPDGTYLMFYKMQA